MGVVFKSAKCLDVTGAGPARLVVQFDNGSVTLLDTGAVANWQGDAALL
jgi:hypothetical protein